MESIRQRTRERQIYGLQISSYQDIRFKASKFKGAKVANITSHCLAGRSRLVLAFWDSRAVNCHHCLPRLERAMGTESIHANQLIFLTNPREG